MSIPWGFIKNEFAAISGDSLAARGDSYADNRQLRQQEALNRLALIQERDSLIGRVDASKAAGIHPLVAMGAQGLGGPVVSAGTSFDPGIGSLPFSTARSIERTPEQKRIEAAQADLAELNVELARKRLAEQPGNGGAVNELTGNNKVVPAEATPYPVSHVKIEGQTLPPSSLSVPHQTPGTAPGWDVVQIGQLKSGAPVKLVVPGGAVQRENWGEQLGELPLWMLPEIVRQSSKASKMSAAEWMWRVGIGGEFPPPKPPKVPEPSFRRGSRNVYGPVD